MSVLVAGDWHGELGWAKQVIERANRLGIDMILHVGDLGIGPWPGDRGGATFVHKLERICTKNGSSSTSCPETTRTGTRSTV